MSLNGGIIFSRRWAMPSADTFTIQPIKELLARYIKPGMVVVDPFARNSKWGTLRNDLNPETEAEYHQDARIWLSALVGERIVADVALFDPPYSSNQIAEHYSGLGFDKSPIYPRFLMEVCRLLGRLLRLEGIAIAFGWESTGLGDNQVYEIEEIMLVNHGARHNDTIVTVQRKIQGTLL